MKNILLYSVLFIFCSIQFSGAQNFSQTLRGTVIDEDGKFPVVGANVIILGSNPVKGTMTDAEGNFRITSVPLGRLDLQVSYMGYEPKTLPNVLVGSGKEVILQVEIKESVIKMNEVTINGTKNKGEVKNEMALLSARSFSVEETKRYAGSFQDPSRMVSAYAGVTSDPMGNNDIVVRGNSPKGIQWRMEGIEIPNPNHFGNEGATGGPISALNSEMLSNSDFYSGAFSPEYGDALSGVFDMKLRNGNNEKHEYSIGVGVLGTDITAEGPFSKNYSGSFLVNYRYSSLAMLNNAGLVDFDGVPKFQDASFKINLPMKKLGTLSLFGLGGNSSIFTEETESPESEKIVENEKYSAKVGVVGLNYTLPVNQNSYFKLTLAASGNGSSYYGEKADSIGDFIYDGEGSWDKSTFRSALQFNSKINTRNRIVIGVKYNIHNYDLYEKYFNEDLKKWMRSIDMKEQASSVQGFISWKYRFTDNFTFVGGTHALHYSLNKNIEIEPRLALKWDLSPKQSVNFGYGLHSKAESIVAYYTLVPDPEGNVSSPNKNMGLSKAHHYVLGYEYHISKNLNSKLEVYYQDLFNIPVENVDTSNFTILNSDEGYINKALVNAGTGKNYGVELTLERYFYKQFYFLLTGSLYNSKYNSLEGIERNTKFNGNYAVNFLAGKEFRLGKGDRANTLAVNAKVFVTGARRYLQVDLNESLRKDQNVYDYSTAWNNKLDDIFQLNMSVSYRINRPRASHEFLIDVLNVTNNQARTWEYYDNNHNQIKYYKQLSLLPNIMYRVHF